MKPPLQRKKNEDFATCAFCPRLTPFPKGMAPEFQVISQLSQGRPERRFFRRCRRFLKLQIHWGNVVNILVNPKRGTPFLGAEKNTNHFSDSIDGKKNMLEMDDLEVLTFQETSNVYIYIWLNFTTTEPCSPSVESFSEDSGNNGQIFGEKTLNSWGRLYMYQLIVVVWFLYIEFLWISVMFMNILPDYFWFMKKN